MALILLQQIPLFFITIQGKVVLHSATCSFTIFYGFPVKQQTYEVVLSATFSFRLGNYSVKVTAKNPISFKEDFTQLFVMSYYCEKPIIFVSNTSYLEVTSILPFEYFSNLQFLC